MSTVNSNWVSEETPITEKKRAEKLLLKVKKERSKYKTEMVQVDPKTWKEILIKEDD